MSGGKKQDRRCGRWTPTTTTARCFRTRCSSRWRARRTAGTGCKKDIRAELDEDLLEQFHGTVSLPFEAGDNRQIAVKIVDDRGIESLKVIALP